MVDWIVCGISPYYIPRSNPDGFDVNVRCLDTSNIEKLEIVEFDGRNWENAINEDVKKLSKE